MTVSLSFVVRCEKVFAQQDLWVVDNGNVEAMLPKAIFNLDTDSGAKTTMHVGLAMDDDNIIGLKASMTLLSAS